MRKHNSAEATLKPDRASGINELFSILVVLKARKQVKLCEREHKTPLY